MEIVKGSISEQGICIEISGYTFAYDLFFLKFPVFLFKSKSDQKVYLLLKILLLEDKLLKA